MTDFAAYTLAKLLTEQAVITRNAAAVDQWGAQGAEDWQPHLTVACRLFWSKESGGRSPSRTYVNASREVPVTVGGLVLPLGTDVLETDLISQINQWDAPTQAWVLKVAGPIKIDMITNADTHIEASLTRTTLGA